MNIKMTRKLLDLIILIQEFKKHIVNENFFYDLNMDSYELTKQYYNNIDEDILKDLGLSKNNMSFEYVLYFKITDELMKKEF